MGTGVCAIVLGILGCAPKQPGGDTGEMSATEVANTDGDPMTQNTTSPTTDVSDSEAVPVASCACADNTPEPYVDCRRSPCGKIEWDCQSTDYPALKCDPADGGILDIAAVDCALAVLVASEPAYIQYFESPNGGFSYEGGALKIGEGRIGVSQRWGGLDLGSYDGPIELVPLKDADYFVGCQAKADPVERYLCLKDWSDGPALEVCVEADPL